MHFQQAIDRDPSFVLAYTGLADTFNLLGYYNHRPPNDVFPRAKGAAERALEIEPHRGEAQASLGFATLFYDRNWEASERHFTTALSYTPSYASAHQWYGWYLLVMGRFDEMVAAMRRALELDPLSLIINDHLGYALSLAGRHEEAVAQLRRALDLDPRFSLSHLRLGLEHRLAGRMDDALREIELAVELSEGKTGLGYLGQTYGMAGRAGDAQQVLAGLETPAEGRYVSPLDRALVHDGLGAPDSVFAGLEAALDDRVSDLIRFRVLPWTNATRLDLRFESFAERLDLPPRGSTSVGEPVSRPTTATRS